MILKTFLKGVNVTGTVVISVISKDNEEVERLTIAVYEPLKADDIYQTLCASWVDSADRHIIYMSDYEDLKILGVSAWENGVGLLIELEEG
jgi:hypothetical protein